MRVFCRYIRQYGADALLRCLCAQRGARGRRSTTGPGDVGGDYDDFADEEALLRFIRNGK